ncbi:uncharacterized protein LOC135699478 [Ochlerotatus camptorhynchus]|uniref:uncharacterized protein LOC135699478 n=1 Tax=Ochlerotatus camptorhynchus TaxID=644619 RepID=UPI0031D9F8B1
MKIPSQVIFAIILTLCLSQASNCRADEEDDINPNEPDAAEQEVVENFEETIVAHSSAEGEIESSVNEYGQAQISGVNILVAPRTCPKGQKLDHRGNCRKVSYF